MKSFMVFGLGVMVGMCGTISVYRGNQVDDRRRLIALEDLMPSENVQTIHTVSTKKTEKRNSNEPKNTAPPATWTLDGRTTTMPAVLMVLDRYGLGSQITMVFLKGIYMEEHMNRSGIIVDEAASHYAKSETEGFLRGFFSPEFPVIDSTDQFHLLEPLMAEGYNYTWRGVHTDHFRLIPDGGNGTPAVECSWTASYRADSFRTYAMHWNTKNYAFLDKVVKKFCPSMKFNPKARRDMAAYRLANGVEFDFNAHDLPSVAFHVRRGDKLLKESKKFEGVEYVEKLLNVTSNNTHFGDCFVATDSYDAVEEIRAALKQYNVTCKLWTLTKPTELGATANHVNITSPYQDTLEFMSELEMLARATYFVGTFNSNVGSLATVIRGCYSNRDALSSHYFESYGVDGENWYIR